jgi:hypothetical protein
VKINFFTIILGLALTSCGRADTSGLDNKAKKEFIDMLVYQGMPTMTDKDLAETLPRLESYRDALVRSMPGAPKDYNIRLALAWAYCKWDMYSKTLMLLNDPERGPRLGNARGSPLIYISLMTSETSANTRDIINQYPESKIALFSKSALLDLADRNLSPAYAEIEKAFKQNEDVRLIFQSVAFLDKLLLRQGGRVDQVSNFGRINDAVLLVFLAGNDWNYYSQHFRKREMSINQIILLDDMIAITASNAQAYANNGDEGKRNFWLSRLKSERELLQEAHDNRLAWVDFLLAKCEPHKK